MWVCEIDQGDFEVRDVDGKTYLIQHSESIPDEYTPPLDGVIQTPHYAVEITPVGDTYTDKFNGLEYVWIRQ